MFTYVVLRVANGDNCHAEGYAQATMVYTEDGIFLGGWYEPQFQTGDIIVQKREVAALSPIAALFKYQQWLREGLEESFLTN